MFFAALALLADDAGQRLPKFTALGDATLLAGSCLLVGTIIYSIHRAIVYVVILRVMQFPLSLLRVVPFDWCVFWPFRFTRYEHEHLQRLWRRKEDNLSRAPIAEWGDQVHFLYCTAWATGLALRLASFWKWEPMDARADLRYWVSIFFWIALSSALLSNLRLLCVEAHVDTDAPAVATPPAA